MRASATCKSCGVGIRWAVHATTGRRMPIDIEPTPDGNIVVVGWDDSNTGMPTPIVKLNADEEAITGYHYVSHFATCVDAASHRRKRR